LAEAYKYRGDNPQAVRFYQRYLDAFPEGPEAAVARRNLKELK
jgi:regulator of sirC expression with transglutaminase-like and TPR domain